MLQWYPRLIALLVFAILIAAFLAEGKGRGYSWG